MTNLKGFRTLIFNLVGLAAIFAARKGFPIDEDTKNVVTDILVTILGGGNLYLRSITDTPMGKKA